MFLSKVTFTINKRQLYSMLKNTQGSWRGYAYWYHLYFLSFFRKPPNSSRQPIFSMKWGKMELTEDEKEDGRKSFFL